MKRILLLWLLSLLCISARAEVPIARIEVAVPSNNAALADLAGGVQHALQQLQPELPVTIRAAAGNGGNVAPRTLVIAIGDSALPWLFAEKNNYAAALAFSVSSTGFLMQPRSDDKVTALYRDQPLARQLRLAKLLLPNLRRVGIIHGHRPLPQSAAQLESASELQLQAIDIEDKSDWPKYLSELMADTDVLLGIDDPAIYNGDTIRSILLTTYRRGKFLIGPGRAFVGAGSLGSCYTAPDQYLKQLLDMVGALLRTQKLPAPQYPRAFRVALNTQVAASLGLAIQDENTLTARLQGETGPGWSGECTDGC